MKKIFGRGGGGGGTKLGPKLGFLPFSQGCIIDIAQDCRHLGQCLTSSTTETLTKIKNEELMAQEMIFPVLMLLSVYSNLLVFIMFLIYPY